MADPQQAQETVEKQPQQEPMPSSDEQSSSQELAGDQEDSGDDQLPSGVKERTREQFEKLRSQLRDARDRIFNLESTQYTQQPSQSVQTDDSAPLYDPKTGLVDVAQLENMRKASQEANRRADQLEKRLQQQQSDSQVRELYEVHPELKNPKSKEAKELYTEAERIWLHSTAYPEKYGGMALTQKQAADMAKKRLNQTITVDAKQEAAIDTRGQPSQAPGNRQRVQSEQDAENLRIRTRLGDKNAMIERMRAIREAQAKE